MKNPRTRTIINLLIVLPVLISACASGIAGAKAETPSLTEADFSFLAIGVSYDDVVARVGKPDQKIGNDKYVFVYHLVDGRDMFLTFESLDQLSAAVVRSATGSFDVILTLEN